MDLRKPVTTTFTDFNVTTGDEIQEFLVISPINLVLRDPNEF